MAKDKRSKKSRKVKGRHVASASFGNRKFGCYGKRVRVGKKPTKVPRVFCSREDK